MQPSHQKAILTAMLDPGFYPHRVKSIARRETHISTVFLTGPYVYKVKKPVNLGFLDFTSLEKRTHYCKQEVILNRRLASGVYLDVVPITCREGKYALSGIGETVESVVKMRQLNDTDAMLPHLQQGSAGGCQDQGTGRSADRFLRPHATRRPAGIDRQTRLGG